jgi:hypothetical protein
VFPDSGAADAGLQGGTTRVVVAGESGRDHRKTVEIKLGRQPLLSPGVAAQKASPAYPALNPLAGDAPPLETCPVPGTGRGEKVIGPWLPERGCAFLTVESAAKRACRKRPREHT